MGNDPKPPRGGMILLPPRPGLCEQCAVKHAPEEPHNRDSLHYQYWFYGKHGRWPVWKDAVAHCAPEVQAAVEKVVRKHGKWEEPPAVPDVMPKDM